VEYNARANAIIDEPDGDIETQAKQVMENLGAVLKAAGSGWSNVLKCSIFLADMDDFGKVNEIYGSYFDREPPARETVAVKSLPKNVLVIGTMNTADRSIALVDSAMRRRFYFTGFLPQQQPIDGLLERWLAKRGYDHEPARLLHELNRRIDDKDFAVGPSYLMSEDVTASGGLERIWEHAILPLLEEHYVGTSVEVEGRLGLEALRKALRQLSTTAGASATAAGQAAEPGGAVPSEAP
jgi:reactive intermediate/imine deaminase